MTDQAFVVFEDDNENEFDITDDELKYGDMKGSREDNDNLHEDDVTVAWIDEGITGDSSGDCSALWVEFV